jgi:membrane-bound ClpP family serine protease
MDLLIVIILCLIGILLILIEIFLIPGITVAAIAGGLFYVGSIWYAYHQLGPMGGTITLISSILVFGIAFVWLIKSKALETIALKTDINSTVAPKELLSISEGDKGISLSRLNPIGKVKVNNIVMEGKSLGDFIDENTEIEVIKVNSTQLIVKTN